MPVTSQLALDVKYTISQACLNDDKDVCRLQFPLYQRVGVAASFQKCAPL